MQRTGSVIILSEHYGAFHAYKKHLQDHWRSRIGSYFFKGFFLWSNHWCHLSYDMGKWLNNACCLADCLPSAFVSTVLGSPPVQPPPGRVKGIVTLFPSPPTVYSFGQITVSKYFFHVHCPNSSPESRTKYLGKVTRCNIVPVTASRLHFKPPKETSPLLHGCWI